MNTQPSIRPIASAGILTEGPRNPPPNSLLPMPSWVDYWATSDVTIGPWCKVVRKGYRCETWQLIEDWARLGPVAGERLFLPIPMRRLGELLDYAEIIVKDLDEAQMDDDEVWQESLHALHCLMDPEQAFRPRGFPDTVRLFLYPKPIRIALVACGKSKEAGPVPASRLYKGYGVRQGLAEGIFRCGRSHTYVLSAEHHLVPLERELVAYEKTLKGATKEAKERWATSVFTQLWARYSVEKAEVHLFAGKDYYEALLPLLPKGWRVVNVLEGLSQGKRNKELKRLRAEREHILTPSKEALP